MEEKNLIFSHLEGIVLTSPKATEIDIENVEGVQIVDLLLPGNLKNLEKRLSPFLGVSISKEEIVAIKQKVIAFYQDHYHPIVHVEIPDQNSSSNVLQLIVEEASLGEIRCDGNRYFSDGRLLSYTHLISGKPINIKTLTRDLSWINRNPFRQTNAVFVPAEKPGFTDIELITEDRLPFRPYFGIDNTGIEESGTLRLYGGFNLGNLFGLDQQLSYQFTSGTDYDKFYAHTLQYIVPLPWRNILNIYGGYSHVRAPIPDNPGTRTNGDAAQSSLRYEIPLPPTLLTLQELTLGFDWKMTDTNLDSEGEFFFGKNVNLTQLMIGYNCGLETRYTKNSFKIELFGSPGQWLPDQSNQRYNELRAGAKNSYLYARGSINNVFTIPYCQCTLEPSIRFQVSSTNLLASEQFGLGGYNTVRGYKEREVNSDNIFLGNVELRTPPFPILRKFFKSSIQDQLTFLIFLDYAYAINHKRFFDEPNSQYLLGAGPGVRYILHPYLTFRCDLGFRLHDLELQNTHQSGLMWYYGLILSY